MSQWELVCHLGSSLKAMLGFYLDICKEGPTCFSWTESLEIVNRCVWTSVSTVVTHTSRRNQPSCSQLTGSDMSFFFFFYFVVGMHITQCSSVDMHVTTRQSTSLHGGRKVFVWFRLTWALKLRGIHRRRRWTGNGFHACSIFTSLDHLTARIIPWCYRVCLVA